MNQPRFFALGFLLTTVAFPLIAADTAPPATTNAPTFSIDVQRVVLYGADLGMQAVIATAHNKIGVRVPAQCRLQADESEERLTVFSASGQGSIRLRVADYGERKLPGSQRDAFRQLAAALVKSATIQAEYDKGVLGTNAWVFDLNVPGFSGSHAFKCVYIPIVNGHVEVQMQSPAAELEDMEGALNQILGSLQRVDPTDDITFPKPVLTGQVRASTLPFFPRQG